MAPPPQLSVEPKVPFLRSLAHFAFAATSLARPRGFLARHGRSPRQRCWPPSIPQKLLPQQGAREPGAAARPPRGHSQTGTRAGRGRTGRGREGKSAPLTHNSPVSPDHRQSDGRRRTVDRRSKARWSSPVRGSRAMSDRQGGRGRARERASERHGVMAAAPKSDARGGRGRGRESLGMEFRTAFLKGCGNSGLRESTATRPVRSVRAEGAGKAQKVRIPPRFPPVAPPSLPPVTSPRAASPPHRLFAEVVEPTPGAPNQRGSGEGIGPPSLRSLVDYSGCRVPAKNLENRRTTLLRPN